RARFGPAEAGDAVPVHRLMLDDPRRPAGEDLVEGPAVLVLPRQPHRARTGDHRLIGGNAQAALVERDPFRAGRFVRRIDQHPERLRRALPRPGTSSGTGAGSSSTAIRSGTPTCGAAGPAPGASCRV